MHDAPPCYMLFGMLGAMSAAFVCWVPNKDRLRASRGSEVSVLFLPCTMLSLLAVNRLPRTLSRPDDFSFWLALLHVLLVLPQIVSALMPSLLPKMKGASLYRLLALLIALQHWLDPFLTPQYAWPVSDCQLSISCDLLLCSFITVYAIYVDTKQSLLHVSVALLVLPLAPPGVVLALHLCRQCPPSLKDDEKRESSGGSGVGLHSSWVTWLQEMCARHRAEGTDNSNSDGALWMNLGQWASDDVTYTTACESLAASLGNHVLQEGDGVLACGCGYGAELLFWKESFSLAHITGIDTNPRASKLFPPTCDVRLLPVHVANVRETFCGKVEFNRIVALDSVYHFEDKRQFFADSASLLPERGSVGVTDLILSMPRKELPIWVTMVLRAMHVKVEYLWTEQEYRSELIEQGWEDIQVKHFEASNVLAGWFPASLRQHLHYAIVVAHRSSNCASSAQGNGKRKKKVAIVGSGLSGLVTAHALAGSHDVTIFEASDKGGLSGKGEMIHGQVVDIPLRIIGQGYYKTVEAIARSVHVRVDPIREDHLTQAHYAKSRKTFTYTRSTLRNFFSLIPYLSELATFRDNLYASSSEREGTTKLMSGGCNEKECETWGTWMTRHGYAVSMYQSSNSTADSQKEEVDSGGVDSYLMWLFMGQASWMLSCSYQSVLHYPAHVLLDFFRSLGVGADVADAVLTSGSQTVGRMLRVKPSMQALDFALRYGVKIVYNTRVTGVGADKVINGEQFDAVVLATEASAVQHVLSPAVCSPVFSDVQYQASSIYLHTDVTLLPAQREDWKAFNICQDSTEDMCMLTAWLNQYYTNATFTRDVFQTWNPHVLPAEEETLKVVHFQRVVHNSDTPRILKAVRSLQGKHGLYYAGAYSVDGMGLLEQAAISGQAAAERVRADLE